LEFFLGTHHPDWLARAGVPLFVSRRSLSARKTLPRAAVRWALDSGGFTELSMHGGWRLTPYQYVDEVRRYRDEIGELAWAAPQDWMCEPQMLARTRMSVEQHQALTISNYRLLRVIAPELPIIPVLQGWSPWDYLRHLEMYDAAGFDLRVLPLVGVGTVCRRQNTTAAGLIFSLLHSEGLRLHGFGLKATGLRASAGKLASADSLAWSLNARKNRPLPECEHKSCANCMAYALDWRERLLSREAA
jgi:hypothetical protein